MLKQSLWWIKEIEDNQWKGVMKKIGKGDSSVIVWIYSRLQSIEKKNSGLGKFFLTLYTLDSVFMFFIQLFIHFLRC